MSERPDSDLPTRIGERIRRTRKAVGLTLVQVAELSGMSQPYLSQAENGRTMVSILALHKIAAALGTSARHLLEDNTPVTDDAPTSVVRANEGTRYALSPGSELRYCIPEGHAIQLNEVTAAAHSSAETATTHPGEEGLHVLEGTIRLEIDGQSHVLGPGDTCYYSADRQHQWFNDSPRPAKFLFMGTSPGL